LSRVSKGIFLSVALHVLLAVAFFFGLPQSPKNPEPMVIEFAEVPALTKTENPKLDKHVSKQGSQRPTLKDLLPAKKFKVGRGEVVDKDAIGADVKDPTFAEWSRAAVSEAETIGFADSLEMYPFVEEIWKRIESKLTYPNDFVSQRIGGELSIQFEVSPTGEFTGQFYGVRSDEPILTTYAMVVVIHALSKPLPEKIQLKRKKPIVFAAQFRFETYSYSSEPPKRQGNPHFKNYLSFLRQSYVLPQALEELERFRNKYIPPIIPVPGGFLIDFVAAYKMYKAHTEPDEQVQRKHRLQTLGESLKLTIAKETKKKSELEN
jgi:hypothetical protein